MEGFAEITQTIKYSISLSYLPLSDNASLQDIEDTIRDWVRDGGIPPFDDSIDIIITE